MTADRFTLIDDIFTNNFLNFTSVILTTDISDQLTIFLYIQIALAKTP